jgi:hypothetical protein
MPQYFISSSQYFYELNLMISEASLEKCPSLKTFAGGSSYHR